MQTGSPQAGWHAMLATPTSPPATAGRGKLGACCCYGAAASLRLDTHCSIPMHRVWRRPPTAVSDPTRPCSTLGSIAHALGRDSMYAVDTGFCNEEVPLNEHGAYLERI